jgi:adenine-specific DNA-methyltransferase
MPKSGFPFQLSLNSLSDTLGLGTNTREHMTQLNTASIRSLEGTIALQSGFLSNKPMSVRKSLGQYFTGELVANYMASLVKKPHSETVKILDAGAGTGILTLATAFRCLHLGCKSVHATLYELDQEALPYLEQTLAYATQAFEQRGGHFTFEIRNSDFVLARDDIHDSRNRYDISVINPPYFKYSAKTSPYAKKTSDLYRGDPNIYASFMAIVVSSMKDGGQVVTITPRSFTNGLYFKGLRNYLLTHSCLDLVHIFKLRDKVFKNSDSAVLQENIICRFVKAKKQGPITVRSSDCDVSINNADSELYPLNLIIDPSNDERMIRVPESSHDAGILRKAETLPTTFRDAGYFISTGRVVEHRTREYITTNTDTPNSVPLCRPHNVTSLRACWTGKQEKDVSFILHEGHEKHTIKNNTFVLLKRFSSKDEKRRLVSGVHVEGDYNYEQIGFGNKTNYIGLASGDLTKTEAYGLSAVFNSSFMDKYFRCISGNTQVNATEIRVMKFPTRQSVIEIGKQAQKMKTNQTNEIDKIVNPFLS